jgi:hypothetical protein
MSNSDPKKVTPERRDFGIAGLGGPTVAIDNAGHRFLSDPTFGPPWDFGYPRKTAGPALGPDALGAGDAVLLSHDVHPDNFDGSGRAFALAAQHGPDDGEADAEGSFNCEVAGLSSALPRGGASMSAATTPPSRSSARSATVWAPSSTRSCSAARQASRPSLSAVP